MLTDRNFLFQLNQDVGEQAFGKNFRVLVDVSVILVQLSVCTVFFSNMGENLSSVFRQLLHSQESRSDNSMLLLKTILCDRRGVMMILLPAILWLSSLPNLKSIAPSIALASLLMAFSFVLIGIVICMNWSMGLTRWRANHATLTDFVKEVDWKWVPLATCAIMYSLEGDQLILPIETAMTYPENFDTVLTVSMVFIAVLFCIFSSACIVAFGLVNDGSITAYLLDHEVELEADQGTNRMDGPFSLENILLLANVIVSLSLVFTYPLQLFPCIGLAGQIIVNRGNQEDKEGEEEDGCSIHGGGIELEEERLKLMPVVNRIYQATATGTSMEHVGGNTMISCIDEKGKCTDELVMEGDSLLLRFSMVISTFLVAIIIPHLKSLIALAGAVTGAATSLIIPPLLGLKFVSMNRNEKMKGPLSLSKRVCFYVFLIIIGVIYGVMGTISSIEDVISQYRKI